MKGKKTSTTPLKPKTVNTAWAGCLRMKSVLMMEAARDAGADSTAIGQAFRLDGPHGIGPKARMMARTLQYFGFKMQDVREIKVMRDGNRW